jgi:hypothetical protein
MVGITPRAHNLKSEVAWMGGLSAASARSSARPKREVEMPVIVFPNSARSAQIPETDVTALIFHFGESPIGIAIPKVSLLSLGQELSAASAPTDGKPQ